MIRSFLIAMLVVSAWAATPIAEVGTAADCASPSHFASYGYSYLGKYAWPEFINWSASDPTTARQEAIIDPQTGLSIKRLTMPMDRGSSNDHAFVSASTPTGVWTNKDNILVAPFTSRGFRSACCTIR